MKKKEIVKNNILFNDIIHTGNKRKNLFFIIYNKESTNAFPKFGIAISKKLGNAVLRNKQKRRMRELLTKNKKIFSKYQDYIIIIRKDFITANFAMLEKELINIMK